MRWILIIAAAAMLTSCSAEKKDTDSSDADTQDQISQDTQPETFTMTEIATPDATNPVVSVDGEVLTLGELQTEAQLRLSGMPGIQMTPEIMSQMQGLVVDQYITRTLILNEAKERELTVTEEDLEEEFDQIRQMIPPEVTIDDMLEKSPLGREAMLEHIKNKILIGKVTSKLAEEKISITDKEVDEFIEENKDELTLPERVEARHILLLFDPNDDEKAKAEKKKQLEEIRKKILDGADFEEMARTHSDCGSAQQGGYLGKFDKSKMVPEFAEAAFSQKVGEVGDVVETQFGYHIIKVEDHEEAGMFPREEIKARMRDLKMQTVMQEFIENLREEADIKRF